MNLAEQARIWTEEGEEKQRLLTQEWLEQQWPTIVDTIKDAAYEGESTCQLHSNYLQDWYIPGSIDSLLNRLEEEKLEFNYDNGNINITWGRVME